MLFSRQSEVHDEQLWRVEIKISVGVPPSIIRVSLKKGFMAGSILVLTAQ